MENTFNPCDECDYSFSKQNQESGMCRRCEFKQLQDEIKKLKENGAFSGVELAMIATNLMTLEQYQSIGTVEECREAVERMKPKKVKKIQIPNTSWSKACTRFECPSCNKFLNYMELSHCGLCGQALNWSE